MAQTGLPNQQGSLFCETAHEMKGNVEEHIA